MPLSDKALSVFAFAAYHQLESGQTVSAVIRRDGAGHAADEEGAAELQAAGLVEITERELVFTPGGLATLETAVATFRSALSD